MHRRPLLGWSQLRLGGGLQVLTNPPTDALDDPPAADGGAGLTFARFRTLTAMFPTDSGMRRWVWYIAITRTFLSSHEARARDWAEGLSATNRAAQARAGRVSGSSRRGLSNAEIGREFVISDTTVKTHITQILMKLNLRDRVQAVVLAYDEMALFDHS